MSAMFPPMPGDATPLRHAALLLHAVGEADRAWLLAHVPGTAKPLLEGMLRELAELGLPADPSAVRQALRDAQPAPADPAQAARAALLAADPMELDHLLAHEPAALASQVRAQLAPGAGTQAGSRLDEFLVIALARRLEQGARRRPVGRLKRAWASLRARRWRG